MKTKIKNLYQKISSNEYVRAFFYIFVLGFVIFSLEAAPNGFTLPLMGDYHMQTYAFYSQGYELVREFFKTGQIHLFDFSNYLGANFLGVQSFYYVFSPLFYLLCLWPRRLLYQGIFVHMIVKFSLGGLFFYILLRKYFYISKKISLLGGFIYAFSGWSLFYLWFHFGDVVTFFPLMLLGFEKCLQERKGWLLSIGIFLCGCASYFFLVNFCIFGVFYALYRWIYIYGINKKRGFSAGLRWSVLLQGVLHFIIGVMLSCLVLLPSLHVASQSTRTESAYLVRLLSVFFNQAGYEDNSLVFKQFKTFKELFTGANLKELFLTLFWWEERTVSSTTSVSWYKEYGYILSQWLFLNTNCWNASIISNSSLDNAIGGMFITTPLTILLVPSIITKFKEKRPWAIFGIIACIVLPFLPITNHMAFAFTNLYGRWQIWIVAIGIIFIIKTLDNYENINRRYVTFGLITNYILAGVTLFISIKSDGFDYNYMYIIFIGELLVMALVWAVYRFKIFNAHLVKQIMLILAVVEVGVSSIATIENKGFYKWSEYFCAQDEYYELQEVIDDLKEEDKDFYRIFNTKASKLYVNLPSSLNYAGSSMFNSTYDFNLNNFIKRSRSWYNGSWLMGDNEKRAYYSQYIGTKYYILDKNDLNNDNNEYHRDRTTYFDGHNYDSETVQDYDLNIPFGYEFYKAYDNYVVYVNKNFNGIGYCLDKYITSENVGTSSQATKYEEMYTKMAIIYNKDEDKVVDFDRQSSYYESFSSVTLSSFDCYFSMRQDYESDGVRKEYKLEGSSIYKDNIASILPDDSQFLHKRWEEREFFGDEFIFKTKNNTVLFNNATPSNKCYVNVNYKLGPACLISFYHGDKLVTQDAHMNCGASTLQDSFEWKAQRGFYIDEPVDKIVLEFLQDYDYDTVFTSSNQLSFSLNYQYESEYMANINNNIEHGLKNVTYKNSTFTFDSMEDERRIAVTNIPIDDGWTLKKSNGEKVEIFDVNGGFIGFIVEPGEESYTLYYYTPALNEGLGIAGVGILLLIVLCFVYKKSNVEIQMTLFKEAEDKHNKVEKEEEIYFKNFKSNVKKHFKKKEKEQESKGDKDGI